jgi:PKHD-type hydroxylase
MSRGKRLVCSTTLHNAIEGGEFEIFNGEKVFIDLKVGEVVVFPTWLFHRVSPVLKGKRLSLITWMKGDPIDF